MWAQLPTTADGVSSVKPALLLNVKSNQEIYNQKIETISNLTCYNKIKYVLLIMVLLVSLLIMGCDEAEEPQTGPLFLTTWGIGAGQLRNAETGEPVSEETDSLMYRKILRGYHFYITYEFKSNELNRVYLNVTGGDDNEERNIAMLNHLEDMISDNMGPLRYVQTDDMMMLGETTLCEMRQVVTWDGLKAKIIFYDVNSRENASFVDNFEAYWRDERWPKGRMQ